MFAASVELMLIRRFRAEPGSTALRPRSAGTFRGFRYPPPPLSGQFKPFLPRALAIEFGFLPGAIWDLFGWTHINSPRLTIGPGVTRTVDLGRMA